MGPSRVCAILISTLLLATGCMTTAQRTAMTAAAHRPAPANPDLSSVMERYYEGVADARWAFAYGMLSSQEQNRLDRAALRARYAPYTDLNVDARQTSDRTVVARITAIRRADRRPATIVETATLAWAGDHWVIDRLRDTP